MSHINMGFTGSNATMQGEAETAEYRKKLYREMYGEGKGYPMLTEMKTVPSVNGVFVLGMQDEKKSSKECLADYEPHENRNVKHPTTNSETLLHLLKGSLGTGILAMPLAFYHAGYLVGGIGTLVIGLICTYSIHLLLGSQYELCKRRRLGCLNYPDTAEAALSEGPSWAKRCAPYAPVVINTFLLTYQLGCCCVYVVFVSTNIKDVVDQYHEPMDVRLYMVMILLPLILINWVRNLKYLAPFSTLANILTFVGFAITLYYIFTDVPSITEREPVGKLEHMPLFFGTVLFALEAIGVILPLENNMKTPQDFAKKFGVLNQAMLVIITLYVGMGFFGFLKYGALSKGSITLNLPPDEILAQSVKIMLAISIFVTHGVACYVAIDIAWNTYLLPRFATHKHKTFFEYITRTCLVLVTFLLAVAIPNLELFISLFGALCLSTLGIAFPAIIDSATWWYDSEKPRWARIWMHTKNSLLCIFGLVGFVIGTYTSLSDIVHEFS